MKNNPFLFWPITFLFFGIPYLHFYLSRTHALFLNEAFSYLVIVISGISFSLFVSKFLKSNLNDEYKNMPIVVLIGIIILYSSFLFLITISNYNRMISQSIDVQHYHIQVWKLSEFTIPSYNWSQHFEPILFFLAPIYWFFKEPGILMILQAIIFISGAIPVYLTVKKYLYSRLVGLSLAFAYLAFGGTQFGIAYGFHPIMFFPTIFLWMYYFYKEKRGKLYFLFVLLSLMVKEEVSFIMIFWGIYLFIFKKDRKLGALTIGLGVLWYILCFYIIFPKFNPGQGFGYWGQYSQQYGNGVIGIIAYIILNPLDFLKTLITPSYKIDTFVQSFGSFSFLMFLFPPSFIIVIPALFEKLLSNNIAAVNGAHYSAALTAVTLVATIESLMRIVKSKLFIEYAGKASLFIGALLLYLAFFFNMLYGFYAFSLLPNAQRTGYPVGKISVEPSDENLLFLSRVIDSIPKQASVAAQYQIIPHLNKHFELITDIPKENENADYVLVDTQLPPPVLTDTKLLNDYLDKLDKSDKYNLAINNLGVVLFKRADSKF